MIFGIDLFCGTWKSEDGYTFEIAKTSDSSARVSIYDPNEKPIIRPYFGDRPTINLPADYDEYNGDFNIHLWTKGRRFTLDLMMNYDRPIGREGRYELQQSITRYEKDGFLEQYTLLFGKLKSLTLVS